MSNQSVIPFLSAREINSLDDFIRFRHTKSFISQKSSQVKDSRRQTPGLIELMKMCGYASFQKFREHRQEWDLLERKVPLVYLGAIGADIESIMHTVCIDQQEYDMAFKVPLFPRFAVVRLMAAVYQNIEFPAGADEDKAVNILKEYSREKGLRCCINYPDLKTIRIEPDGNVFYSYYRPAVEISGKWAIFISGGRNIGVTRLS